ncbi:MAG: apolipoprotein N-acyltransferase, partial [Deltaproteobacteria bacterium]
PTLAGMLHYAPLAVSQVADLAGVYAVSFVVVAVNVVLAECWLHFSHRRTRGAAPRRELLTAGLLVAATIGYGLVRLDAIDNAGPMATGHLKGSDVARGTPIAIVQGNLDLGSRWSPELYGRNLDVYLELTEQSASSAPPRIVFWPENAMTFFVDQEPIYRAAIAHILSPLGAQLVAGAPRQEVRRGGVAAGGRAETRYYNSAFLLSPEGEILGRYDKQHLLPFAEYFPLEKLDFMKRSFGRVREFSPGRATPPLPSAAGGAGVVICNEAMFPRVARKRVAAGAAYLVNLANDSWIPSREFAEHQFDMISMRAIELRRFLVRASTSGPSGVISPAGRVLVRTEPFRRGFVRASIAPRSDRTLYAIAGDWFAWLCVAIALSAAGFAAATWRRRK